MYPLYNVTLKEIKDDQTLADYIETIKQREYKRGFEAGRIQGSVDTAVSIAEKVSPQFKKNGVGY